VAIVGASGYTGAELVRLCLAHPRIQITGLFAQRSAGDSIFKSFPQLIGAKLPSLLRRFEAADVAAEADVALLALPHGESVPAARALVSLGVTVLDLSADFRLRDPGVYAAWYGPHGAPELLPEAVYGLVERHRSQLQARPKLVAVPGCYPTATLLALAPLLARGLISPRGLIVDAKSGVSGAGRTPGLATHFPEAGEGVKAYKVAEHRHTPEIEQELTLASGSEVRLTFTPHLIPMVRGILSTCYAATISTRFERPTSTNRSSPSSTTRPTRPTCAARTGCKSRPGSTHARSA
jgi:N-acetyl-gamma-glutamyl-phosphate reductase